MPAPSHSPRMRRMSRRFACSLLICGATRGMLYWGYESRSENKEGA